MRGKVALVTGGARGIGAATVMRFARAGFAVAVADIRLGDEAEKLLSAAACEGADAEGFECDVASVSGCRALIASVGERFGRLDVLVNNAGGAFGTYATLEETDIDYYDRVMAVNLRAPFVLTQAAAPALRKAHGAVVNVASELVYRGYELMVPYTAAKGGIVSMTRSLALALAPDVRVNAVAPGPTTSERFMTERWYEPARRAEIPLQRFGMPSDVADAIHYLASGEANQITGQTLSVNGGVVMP